MADDTPLAKRIAALIARDGPMRTDVFMAHALYDPHDGYYTTRRPLGAEGDFTTAPEITQVFGELLGLWTAQGWVDLGRPDPLHLAELGPGRGVLMSDALRAGSVLPGFVEAARVALVEANPHLRAEQAARLNGRGTPVWFERLEDVPEGPAILLANEFLDCLPVAQAARGADGLWRPIMVGLDADRRFRFGAGEALEALPPDLDVGPDDRLCEWAPGLPAFVDALACRLRAAPGRALLIDYGDPSGPAGHTLQALFRHAKVSPLSHVGHADLTAHVDFRRLARLAREAGLQVHGPVTQGDFLRSLGVETRLERLMAANPDRAGALSGAVARLIDPAHMGSLFQAICLSSPGLAPPPGL